MKLEYRYKVLALLSLVSGLAAYLNRGVWFFDVFVSSLSAGFIGSLVTVALIDRAAERRRETDRSHIERIAMRQARLPLVQLVALFSDMIKASSPHRPEQGPASVAELLREETAGNMNWLDITGSAGLVDERTSWLDRIDADVHAAFDRLSSILDKYMAFLPVDTVDEIDLLVGDDFLLLLRNLSKATAEIEKAGVHRKYSIDLLAPIRRKCLDRLLTVVRSYERSTRDSIPVPDSFVRDDVAPGFGTSRLERLVPEYQIGLGAPPL